MGLKGILTELFDWQTDEEKARQARIKSYITEGPDYVQIPDGRVVQKGSEAYQFYKMMTPEQFAKWLDENR